ncbi:hypothetical protein RP29_15815 [Acidovorax temperans]|uniref:Uncharacterized protein n=1 Tax=Acidovorax temperans TaxID=80878 RepID=A0A0D7K6D1_9BURK|nr:hypothetical protein RP29_15815 [Acidovorax temperans]
MQEEIIAWQFLERTGATRQSIHHRDVRTMHGSHGSSFVATLTMRNMLNKCFDSLRKKGMTGAPLGNHTVASMVWNAGQPQTREKSPKITLTA